MGKVMVLVADSLKSVHAKPSSVMSCSHLVQIRSDGGTTMSNLIGLKHSSVGTNRYELLIDEDSTVVLDSFHRVSTSLNPVTYQEM